MVQEAASSAGSADRTGRIAAGSPVLVIASIGGTLLALALWVTRGWAEALACYVATILLSGGIVLWRTGLRPTDPHEPAAATTPAVRGVGRPG